MARTALSYKVSTRLAEMGFPTDFAYLVGTQMNTDFTARMMLGYLRAAQPETMEEVADEMLGILSLRDKLVERKILNQ